MLNITYIFPLFAVYFSSCAKEEFAPEESMAESDVLAKKGEGVYGEKDYEPDCNCEMRVISVMGYSGGWAIRQPVFSGYSGFIITGVGSYWYDGGPFYPLPSEFRILDPSEEGCRHFRVSLFSGPVQNEVVLNTEVNCYLSGSLTPATTTSHQFVVPLGMEEFDFWRLISCLTLTGQEGADCSPSGSF